jgi:hypothetical protein
MTIGLPYQYDISETILAVLLVLRAKLVFRKESYIIKLHCDSFLLASY